MMSRSEREGLTLGRAEESLDHPSGESPRPWRKRMATLLGLGGVVGDCLVSDSEKRGDVRRFV